MAKLARQAIDCDGIDTDATMAANSDSRLASQKAIKTALAGVSSSAIPLSYIDTDGLLTSNSDSKVPTVRAVRTAILGGTISPSLLAVISYLNRMDDWRVIGVTEKPVIYMQFG